MSFQKEKKHANPNTDSSQSASGNQSGATPIGDNQTADNNGQNSQQAGITKEEELLRQIEVLTKEKGDYLELLQRERASFINFRKRVEEEKKDIIAFGQEALLAKWIPLYELFERAFDHLPPELQKNEWVQGVQNIKSLFEKMFHDLDVKKILTVGAKFDSTIHEAMMQVTGPQGIIIAELEAGYTFRGKVLKPAKVSVGNGEEEEKG